MKILESTDWRTNSLRLFAVFCLLACLAGMVRAERLPIKIYTSADGLGSSFVNHLMRDSRGFMWFATRDGLSRFDGSQFVTYRIGAENSPPTVGFVYETRNGDYWITTSGGVFRFKPDAVAPNNQPNRARPTLNAEFVTGWRGSLFEDSAGNLWLGSTRLLRLEERDGKEEFREFDLNLPSNPKRDLEFHGIVEAADGSLWINTTWGLARRLPDGRVIFYQTETQITEGSQPLMIDRDGRVWVARAFEVFVLKPEPLESLTDSAQVQTRPLKETYAVTAEIEKEIRLPDTAGEILLLRGGFFAQLRAKRVMQTADHRVWLTMEKDLFEFDGRVFRRFGAEQGFPTWMGDMAEDAAGNLWIGGRNGLARLDRKGLISYNAADGLRGTEILAVTEARDGTLFFGGGDFQINRFDGRKFHAERAGVAPDLSVLWTSRYAFLDSRNEFWILTSEKLYRFAASDLQKPLAQYTTADGLKADAMFQIFEDSSGTIWVSSQPFKAENRGLARFVREENRFQSFSENDGFPSAVSVSSFAEDLRGNLWFGFYEGGLARFRDGRFTAFSDNLPPDGLITDLHTDKNGRLWLATAFGGVLRVDDTGAENPRLVPLTVDDGLSSNNIRTLAEDNFGRIYAGTVRGVDRISPDTGQIKHFSVADGLAADFVIDSHRDRNGDLWFATMGGLSRLSPLPDEKPLAPPIWIGGLRVAGLPQTISELGNSQIQIADLTDTQNNLQIDFFGLDFRAGETLRYQYRLEGSNTLGWSEPTQRRTMTYGDLSPGEYRFLVRAVNSEGAASENPAVVSFKILPPVWARWWFVALCLLTAALIFIALERYRAARLSDLRVSENRFRKLVEQSPYGIMVLSPDGAVRSVNQAYLELWGDGVTVEQILKWDMRSDEQLTEGGVIEGLGGIFAGQSVTLKFPPLLYDVAHSSLRIEEDSAAKFVWIDALAYAVKDENGNLREVICVLENITARKNIEEALKKSREERIVELERVRSRIATDLHDDIGASLTQIAVLSEVAQAQNGKSAEPLTKISSVSNQLVEAMSDIVWSINPAKDHLRDLSQRMRRFAADVLTAKGISVNFNAPNSDNDISLGTNLRREVFLIFKEAVNNVAKHSGAKQAKIELSVTAENLILTVSDNGCGIKKFRVSSPESKVGSSSSTLDSGLETWGSKGNGLVSMRRRAAEMGGDFEIVSENNSGTAVILRLPLETAAQAGGDAPI